MSTVGQREIRGEVWLILDCDHVVRQEAYEGRCNICKYSTPKKTPPKRKPTKQPRKPRPAKEKPRKPEYTPYSAPVVDDEKSSADRDARYPRIPFTWRGKKRL